MWGLVVVWSFSPGVTIYGMLNPMSNLSIRNIHPHCEKLICTLGARTCGCVVFFPLGHLSRHHLCPPDRHFTDHRLLIFLNWLITLINSSSTDWSGRSLCMVVMPVLQKKLFSYFIIAKWKKKVMMLKWKSPCCWSTMFLVLIPTLQSWLLDHPWYHNLWGSCHNVVWTGLLIPNMLTGTMIMVMMIVCGVCAGSE